MSQTSIIIPLPDGYNKKYLFRWLIDLKYVTGTKKTEQVEEMAARANLSKRQMYNYIDQHISSDKQLLNDDQLQKIAQYYGKEANDLITEKYLKKISSTPTNHG